MTRPRKWSELDEAIEILRLARTEKKEVLAQLNRAGRSLTLAEEWRLGQVYGAWVELGLQIQRLERLRSKRLRPATPSRGRVEKKPKSRRETGDVSKKTKKARKVKNG